jgi:membrane-bound lytic murein transglycosylase A
VFFQSLRFALFLFFLGGATILAAAFFVFSGAVPPFYERAFESSDFGPPELDYRLADYAELTGWLQDNAQDAFSAFLASCEKIKIRNPGEPANPHELLGTAGREKTLSGSVADWLVPCRAAENFNVNAFEDSATLAAGARGFFETHFQPVEIRVRRAPRPRGPARRGPPRIDVSGVFTGYFEPVYPAVRNKGPGFSAPVYGRPADLIDVDLGRFRAEWAGERLAGRVENQALIPYPDRSGIENGAVAQIAEPLAWMEPNDLFFLQIQGSGRLQFDDGTTLRLGYAGQNGHPYTAIGRILVERGAMALEDASMQSIRTWLAEAPPEAASALREQNGSYVFFDAIALEDDKAGPPGTQGVPLTPGRSLAVDRRYHMLGAPVWVDIEPVAAFGPKPIRRLMIAQDTGGAIKGPLRGDVFWGTGAAAGEIAGAMNARGRLFALVPRAHAAGLQ